MQMFPRADSAPACGAISSLASIDSTVSPQRTAGWRVMFWMPLALAFGLALMSTMATAADEANQNAANVVRYAKGRILVQTRAGFADKELDKVLKKRGSRRTQRIKELNVHVVELPAEVDEISAARELAQHPHVKFAELDRAYEPTVLPNDPYYGNAWHLPKIGAPAAWDYSTGNNVTIAILDSGVDATHPDLVPQLVPGWNFYDGNSNTADVYGHGTKVAGAAAAAGNNAAGVAAVSWRSKIMPIRVTDTSGYGYDSLIAQGITWAANNGARVANISFLGVAGSSTILNAAQYMRNKGGVVVVAAGNTGKLESPAASSLVTAVAATDGNDVRPSWSSFGNYVDVAAPGVGVWTTAKGGGYGGMSGTSAASPVTAGVYALMIAANPSLQPSTLDSILFSTAVDLGTPGADQYYGRGRINAAAAVASAKNSGAPDTQVPAVAISAPTGGKVSGIVPVGATASDNVGVTKVELYSAGSLIASDIAAPYAFSWDTTGRADGAATLQAKAYDAAGNVTSSSVVNVTIGNDTTKPQVSITNPAAGSVVTGPVTISVTASDNKKVSQISLKIDGAEVALTYGSSLSYTWNVVPSGPTASRRSRQVTTPSGSHSIVATALDPSGNTASTTVYVSVP